MAVAIFNDQETLAGQKLGISTAKALALTVMACGLAAMNIYHMGNAVTSKLLTPDSSVFYYALLYFIACCIAFMEVPVTEEIVTQEARGRNARGHRLMLAVIVIMAIGAGLYSITSDADKRTNSVEAHSTTESTYDDLLNALISDRNKARANATTTQERSDANATYFREKAKLNRERAEHQSTRPALAVKTDSIFHWVWAIGFSLLCSLGVVVITAYLTKYHKPLTEIPRVFFRVREEQEWTMNDDDVRVIPAQVDLTGSSSTRAARKAINAPSSASNSDNLTSPKSGTTENHPHGLDSSSGRKIEGSERSLNDTDKKHTTVAYSNDHYEVIKSRIAWGSIKPTQKPIKSELVKLKVRFVDDAARQQKAIEILEKLKGEGVIIDNPEFGKSGKMVAMYILNPDYSENDEKRKAEETAREEEGELMIRSACPECDKKTSVSESNLKAWSGKVGCTDCQIVYSVKDNQIGTWRAEA